MPLATLPQLPIREALAPLTRALADYPRVLLRAPPGAGKSTVVPLTLLEQVDRRKILMLEPRRIAARAVAQRMAQLLGEPIGRTVGFRTRLETRVTRTTRIEVVTEGILTRMLQSDPELAGVGCVIFDEFHERSLNADLGLALAIESQETLREDLKLLVMSATLDLGPLARLLGGAPIVSTEGRSFEVATHYVPRRDEIALELQTAQVIRRAMADHEGDVLCFLPGAAEIRRVQRALEDSGAVAATNAVGALTASTPRSQGIVRILPLYGELRAEQQDAALRPAPVGERKIVLATSIAETSLTIEGVRIVIDAGLRRYSVFDPATGMSRLVTGKISQAAADQRRGRAGRLAPGVCYRLWSEGAQASLAPYTSPEISSADLAPLALELACWGAADAGQLRWLDPPPAAPLAQARELLEKLAALDEAGRVTPHGRALAAVGAHPRLAHMLIRGRDLKALRLASDLAAILSERDILRAPPGARDVDLRLRVAALRGEAGVPAAMSLDARALHLAARSSAHWQHQLGAHGDANAGDPDPHEWTGPLTALAYPDRIGRARDGSGNYLLANGRGARFGEAQALSKSEFIVAAELDGADRDARIFLAAPLSLNAIARLFSTRIKERAEVVWDEREEAVRARRERRLGALVLESTEMRDADPSAVQRAVLIGLRRLGAAALPWSASLRQWQARVQLMGTKYVPAPEPWPDVADGSLLATLEEWATPWIEGMTRREHLARMDLGNALRSRLSYAQGMILEREAPTHLSVPSGSRIPVDYCDGAVPTLSVRLQEMFGLSVTPSVAGGRVPLLLKLLSPAGRPVQVTSDLLSFWKRGYHEVRKDLKGRYPKHYWPEDPYAAQPTRRVRPR